VLASKHKPDIFQSSSIEWKSLLLLNDENAVRNFPINFVSCKICAQMRYELPQMRLSIAIWNNDVQPLHVGTPQTRKVT